MSDSRDVIRVLDKLAFALELLEGPSPRAKTFQAASRTLWQLSGDVRTMRADGSLAAVRGIGPSVLEVVDRVLAGEPVTALETLQAEIPRGLFEIGELKGLGPSKVAKLWKGLGVTSLGELELACHENRLSALAGFGKKTQENVLAAIQERRKRTGLLLRDRAQQLAAQLVDALQTAHPTARVELAGPLARGEEVVDRLVLVSTEPLDVGATPLAPQLEGVRVETCVVEDDAFGCAAVRHTSDDAHFEALVARAAPRSLRPDGLFDGETRVATATAAALYAALGLHVVEPERRRAGEILVGMGKARPRLVERRDLRGAIHNHTTASDGAATLEEMVAAAEARGLEYLAITEHSQSAAYARGLDAAGLASQRARIEAMQSGVAVFAGVESDILEDGSLDYPDDVLARLELVVASGHRRFGLDRAASSARMVRAASHPLTDVIGHPTGRLLLDRPPLDFDVEAFLDACRANGTAVELNGSPHRLDLSAAHLAMAKERGILVSLAADAHATHELDYLDHAVAIARVAGLTAEDVLNARSATELRAWLAARRAR